MITQSGPNRSFFTRDSSLSPHHYYLERIELIFTDPLVKHLTTTSLQYRYLEQSPQVAQVKYWTSHLASSLNRSSDHANFFHWRSDSFVHGTTQVDVHSPSWLFTEVTCVHLTLPLSLSPSTRASPLSLQLGCCDCDTSRHRSRLTRDNAAVPRLRGTVPSSSAFLVRLLRHDRDHGISVDPGFGSWLDDDDDVVVVVVFVVRAIERLIGRGHRGDQPLPEKTSSRLILPNIIFVEVSPPPLSADRESPPSSLLGQARSRSLRTLVRLAASFSLLLSFCKRNSLHSARYRKCSLFASFRVRRARSSRRR